MTQGERLPFDQQLVMTRLRDAATRHESIRPTSDVQDVACADLVALGYAKVHPDRTYSLRGAIVA